MSELTEKLAALLSPGPSGSDTRATNTPESWKPRMEVDEQGGFLVSTPRPAGEMPDAAQILTEFNLDPNSWTVTSVRKSQWQNHAGEWLEAQRISITPYNKGTIKDSDLEKIFR